jgi:hypothetical protein
VEVGWWPRPSLQDGLGVAELLEAKLVGPLEGIVDPSLFFRGLKLK